MSEPAPTAAEVVAFWREAGPKRWFEKDYAFDEEIRRRFLALHETAADGKLRDWEKTAQGALALLILLDQFPRNMFRGDGRAFATDPLARSIAAGAIVHGYDAQVEPEMRGFFYLPFEHSEDLCRSGPRGRVLQSHRRRRRPEMGGDPRRHHPPLRPVSAPQRRARPQHHAGRTGLPRQRRFRGLVHQHVRFPRCLSLSGVADRRRRQDQDRCARPPGVRPDQGRRAWPDPARLDRRVRLS